MWQNERIVVKHLSEPRWPDAIRISFWALHETAAIERLGTAFERVLSVAGGGPPHPARRAAPDAAERSDERVARGEPQSGIGAPRRSDEGETVRI